ncbi:MAG: DUF1648 domain-containing protein [Chloroflexota bacterium]
MRGKSLAVIIAIILISLVLAIYLYPRMPEPMASHWNARGEVDGYMSKFWGLFLMPIMSIGMALLFVFLPKIDPLRANIEEFRGYYHLFVTLIILFMFYIYLLTLFWNLGKRFDMIQLLSPAFAILFYYAGVLIEKSKRNWFIGIRTPWTLSSDRVWDKTHALGGKLFKLIGVISLSGLILPASAFFYIFFISVIGVTLFTLVYSYLEYRKEAR